MVVYIFFLHYLPYIICYYDLLLTKKESECENMNKKCFNKVFLNEVFRSTPVVVGQIQELFTC